MPALRELCTRCERPFGDHSGDNRCPNPDYWRPYWLPESGVPRTSNEPWLDQLFTTEPQHPHADGPLCDQPSIHPDHYIMIVNPRRTSRASGMPIPERVSWRQYRRHDYQRQGWTIVDLNPPPNREMIVTRPDMPQERQPTDLFEFERYYSHNGWIEYIPRVVPEYDPTDPGTCEHCHHVVHHRLNLTGTDTLACNTCFSEFHECRSCHGRFSETRETVDGYHLCLLHSNGYLECHECDLYTSPYDGYRSQLGNTYCHNCRDNHSSCDDCGTVLDDPFHSGDVCDSCERRAIHEMGSRYIRNYGYKPMPVFHGSDSTRVPYLGIELEVGIMDDGLGECAKIAHDMLGGLGYLKSDCSITDNYEDGFEIVTHPMTHEYARNSFPWSMLEDLKDNGADADCNGIHVHISRDGFADSDHIYRWLRLLMSNKEMCIKVARRDSEQWASFREFNSQDARYLANGGSFDRYEAINCQNSATFELRMFRGSLDQTEVMAAFDLAHASVEYTRDHECYDVHSFTEWLTDNGNYSALLDMIGN